MPLDSHEPREQLPAEVINQHRAIESLIEELEAVMWYHERAAVSDDPELVAVMEHNRDEEIEHAMMNLEWLRRNFPGFDENMRIYLMKTAPITELEEAAESGDVEGGNEDESAADSSEDEGSLNIGSLKKG